MQMGHVEGATRVVGQSQGYLGLTLRDGEVDCPVNGKRTPTMTSAWLPTPKELAALSAGASVHISVMGTTHPPISVGVGKPPDMEPTP